MYKWMLLYLSVFILIFLLFIFIPKNKKTKKVGIISLAVALCLEILVFNFHSFHLLFGSYEKNSLNLSEAHVSGGSISEDGKIISNEAGKAVTIEFKNIEEKIGTVYFNLTMPDRVVDENGKITSAKTDYVNVSVDASDETNSAEYRKGVASGKIVNGDKRSQTIILDLSGKVKNIKFTLTTDKNCTFTLAGADINKAQPMRFSTLRLLIIVALIFGIYALMNFPSMQASVEDKKLLFSRSVGIISVLFIICSAVITFVCSYNSSGVLSTGYKNTSGNQISQELVDAFEAGQVSLLDEPSKELLEMENPYDWSARRKAGVSYKWDHLLFEGKYYSYYGIAPVLVLFLPYHFLTGYYFPSAEAILIFGAIGIMFLSLIFMEIVRKLFPKLSVNIALCSLVILQMSTGIWYCFCSPLFYEIAQASGFMFICAGFYFLLRSNIVVGSGKIKLPSIAIAAFCLSMAVLCRPTLVLYCFAALIFIAFGFIKYRNEAKLKGKNIKTESAKYIVTSLICFVAIGLVQMIYNYKRFGSFFDFGIQYSLTINDFTRSAYHTDFTAIGFWNYLFAFPIIKPQFPFVFSNFSTLDVNGYYYVANRNAVGLAIRSLPVWGYLGAVGAYRSFDKKNKLKAVLLIGSVCIIAPLIIIFSIWESGYGVRYCVDFAWQMIIGAMCILFYRYCKSESDPYKRDMQKAMKIFFLVACIVSVVVNFAMIYDYLPRGGWLKSEYLSFENIFNFWK